MESDSSKVLGKEKKTTMENSEVVAAEVANTVLISSQGKNITAKNSHTANIALKRM